MKPRIDYTLYLVTDRDIMTAASIEEAVESAIRGGCTLVQLREKNASSREFYQCATRVKQITDTYGVPLVINDRADIALAVDAAGVHVGQGDLPMRAARAIVGEDKIVGVSAGTFEEARQAIADGADYLGVGAMYTTATKEEAGIVTIEELEKIRAAFALPIVAIGGINLNTVPAMRKAGVDGIAVVSAVLGQPDIAKAAAGLLNAFAG